MVGIVISELLVVRARDDEDPIGVETPLHRVQKFLGVPDVLDRLEGDDHLGTMCGEIEGLTIPVHVAHVLWAVQLLDTRDTLRIDVDSETGGRSGELETQRAVSRPTGRVDHPLVSHEVCGELVARRVIPEEAGLGRIRKVRTLRSLSHPNLPS